MLKSIESRGIVLYNRDFREDDKLVKIFTEKVGKRMFFVRRTSTSKLNPVIQPLTVANFILNINDGGLSYIKDYREVLNFRTINKNIFRMGSASYIISLADANIQDNQYDGALFSFLEKTLILLDGELDNEILTNIFEIQILSRFGILLNFNECAFCHCVGKAFDFSFKYSGVLCSDHCKEDLYCCRLDPNVLFLLDKFQSVDLSALVSISIKKEMKGKLRVFIDKLYEEYIGIHLKSKKFLDSLSGWGSILKE